MFRTPWLIGIGGFIGSGKTTLGSWLAQEGAHLFTFDAVRKFLLGVNETDVLPAEMYQDGGLREKVWKFVQEQSQHQITKGISVVWDMSFLSHSHVARLESFGAMMCVPMLGLWCYAPIDVLRQRVKTRQKGSSDGTVEFLERMLKNCAGACPRNWIALNTSCGYRVIENKVRSALST